MKKNHRISGQFTIDEKKGILKRIEKSGWSQNQYVRYLLLNVRIDISTSQK